MFGALAYWTGYGILASLVVHFSFGTMITKQSPEITKQSTERQILTIAWRTLLNMAGPIEEQYRRILTGLAAILALMIANLNSIHKVVGDGHLRFSLGLLVFSLLLASIAYLMSSALKAQIDIVYQLEKELVGPLEEAPEMLKASELIEEICKPFWGPMKWLMLRKGADDPFAVEKGSINFMVWQVYAMWVSILFAVVSLFALVCGLN